MKFLKLNRRRTLFIKKFLVIAAIVTILFLSFGTFKYVTFNRLEIEVRPSYHVFIITFFIDNIERISVVAGLIAFILNLPEQQKKSHYEAWEVITLAKGHRGSGGRIQALQDLAGDGVSLAGVNVDYAYLVGVKLSGAVLTSASLESSDLRNANLSSADLRSANLIRANLRSANLIRADLRSADLRSADLSGAKFWDKESGRKTKNITPEQIKQAKNWEKVVYSPKFRKKLGLPPSE